VPRPLSFRGPAATSLGSRPVGSRMREGRRTGAWAAAATLVALAAAVLAPAAGGAKPQFVKLSHIGAWCWFADPRALYAFGRTYVGWVDGQGYVVVATYRDGKVRSTRVAHPAPMSSRDDHDEPALLVEPDGRITAFYSHHNGPFMLYRTTIHPHDVKSWGPEQAVPTQRGQNTYANPVRLSSESKVFLFFRGDVQPTFARRDSKGKWSAARTLVSNPGENPYMKIATNDRDTIGFAFTNGHPRGPVTSIYYARYRKGMISHADGRPIKPLKEAPFTPAQADLVYDAHAHGDRRAWIHDVAFTGSGRPIIVYATFSADGFSHRYEYARWTAHRWKTYVLAEAGGPMTTDPIERHYSGGVVLDHRDPRTVYASIQQGSEHEIVKLVTRDGGKSFARTQITSQSPTDNVRPFMPRNLPKGNDELLWMRGFYDRYRQFKTAIVARP
jgi:putative BNR repeat neuraminidase